MAVGVLRVAEHVSCGCSKGWPRGGRAAQGPQLTAVGVQIHAGAILRVHVDVEAELRGQVGISRAELGATHCCPRRGGCCVWPEAMSCTNMAPSVAFVHPGQLEQDARPNSSHLYCEIRATLRVLSRLVRMWEAPHTEWLLQSCIMVCQVRGIRVKGAHLDQHPVGCTATHATCPWSLWSEGEERRAPAAPPHLLPAPSPCPPQHHACRVASPGVMRALRESLGTTAGEGVRNLWTALPGQASHRSRQSQC
jgi:hypothetical protein